MECEILGFVIFSDVTEEGPQEESMVSHFYLSGEITASVQAPRSQLHSFLANQIAVILDVIRPSPIDSTSSVFDCSW